MTELEKVPFDMKLEVVLLGVSDVDRAKAGRTPAQSAGSEHKVLIELVDANHETLDKGLITFVIPEKNAAEKHH